ncbi:hypothetical protein [Enterococcus sp. AZ103]|uniref:hypothetical protein n=1 Tax=Enterococcus sp. AZ103 TaxID=2774628 RepID=UPI003F2817D9
MQDTHQQSENQDNKKKKRLLLLLLALLLLAAGYLIYDHFFKAEISTTVVAGDFLPDGKDASKMTEKEISDFAQSAVDKSQFNMRIVSEANIDQNTMTGELAIQNPPSNAQPVNVVVTVDDTGEVVYNSGAIQPGEEIRSATLEKELEPGNYPATATFNVYDPDSKKKQGEVQSVLTLMVQ